MTSSDVLDTCLSVQLTQAADLLLADLDAVLAALKARAFEHKFTLTIGRSHGIHAEPTTFGLKLAGHYAEFARDRARLVAARAEIAVAAMSRRGRHLRASRSARGGICRGRSWAWRRSRSPRRSSRATGTRRSSATLAVIASRHRAAGHRGAPPATQRGARGGGVLPSRARRAPARCRTSATRC